MKQIIQKRFASYLLISSIAIVAVFLTMFQSWEPSPESWGYWYFARVFAETGRFIVLDRSPLYILYLNLFTWMPYPTSVTVEYLVTTSITVIAIIAFFRPYIGIWLALLAACIWIPYLQTAEPPVQKLALACSLVAVLLRSGKADRFRLAASYAFLILACLFRQTYILLIIVFLASDILRTMRGSGIKTWFFWRPKLTSDWPIILVIGLVLWSLSFQSPSPWNNIWYSNTEWFPFDGKSMTSSGAIGSFNCLYIQLKYGTFEGHDFYFTNREAFDGATNLMGAILANPQMIFKIIIFNLKNLLPTIMGTIWLPKTGITFIDYFFLVILFVGIIYGAFRAARDLPIKLLLFASLALVGVMVIAIPKWRYIFPMIPIFIMAASWYGTVLASFLKKTYPSTKTLLKNIALAAFAFGILLLFVYLIRDHSIKSLHSTLLLAGSIFSFACACMALAVARFAKARLSAEMSRFVLALPTMLLLGWFSASNIPIWAKIPHEVVKDFGSGQLRFLEYRYSEAASMKAAYPTLVQITKNCRGIMTGEALFLGAFLKIPLTKVYDPWEIPPFGQLNNSPYKGLNPDRIDCILVNPWLTTSVGQGTNIQIRYQNYIKPYVNQLKSMGAVIYEVPYFGQAVVLQR